MEVLSIAQTMVLLYGKRINVLVFLAQCEVQLIWRKLAFKDLANLPPNVKSLMIYESKRIVWVILTAQYGPTPSSCEKLYPNEP